ncbi:two-component system OmpR family response regulator [Novosphingobium capsulatum]|uniref:Two-component system OmpR family response regulator n=1 Tax=Novosphingobium capsulatum TaxID=13688 RepID=A0ABU1MP65_9SPHN|nr:response regulator transcription factor [Novosphingobium capsulatum]MDR6511933.1 two-component system OmpR family response regulator [Novosphingobium capsulatum]
MRILLAEDDSETASFIANGLGELGHVVVPATTGEDALHLALTEVVDIIVLDRMLPRLDGLSVLRRLRAAEVNTPALMLTALGKIEDRVEGLEAGADDYLIKPFAFSEFSARLQALGRRQRPGAVATRLVAGDVEMDLLSREVRRRGIPVVLQPREFRLLEELVRHAGQFVTRTMLLERVWHFHFDPQTKIVETQMSRLRAKLNEGGLPDTIETVRGVGYRMLA